MNLDKLNKWLILVANVGVVLGLVFLGIEINQSKLAMQAETSRARSERIEEAAQEFALSDSLAVMYDKLERDGAESLDPIQLRRIRSWESSKILRINSQIRQYNEGLLGDDDFESALNVAAINMQLWESLGMSIPRYTLIALENRSTDQR